MNDQIKKEISKNFFQLYATKICISFVEIEYKTEINI